MNMKNDFCVFILTHNRSNKVRTYNTLRNGNYTGKIYLLIDDEDKEIESYKKIYKDEVIIFNKQKAIDMTDSMDNLNKRNSVVYARNYNFVIARELGIKYFLQLDDDYTTFNYAYCYDCFLGHKRIKNLDLIFEMFVKYLKNTNITSIAFAQGGDFIGGENSGLSKKYKKGVVNRKVMNSFFCCTNRPFKFSGRINEDVNMYINLGSKGYIFITIANIRLEQITTQQNTGGLTDIYLDLGTYCKSFYTVICNPSCIKINQMGFKEKRFHHKVAWNNAVPLIVDEKYKK